MFKKKIISIVLVIVMIIGMSTMCVNAITYYSSTHGLAIGQEYYIMSESAKKLLAVNTSATVLEETVVTSSLGSSTKKQWYVLETNGNFYLTSKYYNNGSGLAIYGSYPCRMPSAETNGTMCQFNIRRVSYVGNATEQGRYTIMNGSKYLACDSNGNLSTTETYSSDCLWSLMRTEKIGTALYSFNYTGGNNPINSSVNNQLFSNVMSTLGYTYLASVNDSAGNAYSVLPNKDIFIYAGHGDKGKIVFYSNQGTANGCIKASVDVGGGGTTSYVINTTAIDLSSSRCILYIGCHTGTNHSSGVNLVNETYQRGAHFVLGATRTIYGEGANGFIRFFLESVQAGASIERAISNAIEKTGEVKVKNDTTGNCEYIEEFPIYYVGDTSQYLNIP